MDDPRDTPVAYSRDEAVEIRAIVGDGSTPLVCPRCDGDLHIGHPIAGGGTIHPVWGIRCQQCHRSTFVYEVADGHRPPQPLDEPDSDQPPKD